MDPWRHLESDQEPACGLMPTQVQIERVEGVMIIEDSTAFAMYENNELDTAERAAAGNRPC